MNTKWITSLLLLAVQAIAQEAGHEYRKPGPGDGKYWINTMKQGKQSNTWIVRSPCPGLNTLANHG